MVVIFYTSNFETEKINAEILPSASLKKNPVTWYVKFCQTELVKLCKHVSVLNVSTKYWGIGVPSQAWDETPVLKACYLRQIRDETQKVK